MRRIGQDDFKAVIECECGNIFKVEANKFDDEGRVIEDLACPQCDNAWTTEQESNSMFKVLGKEKDNHVIEGSCGHIFRIQKEFFNKDDQLLLTQNCPVCQRPLNTLKEQEQLNEKVTNDNIGCFILIGIAIFFSILYLFSDYAAM